MEEAAPITLTPYESVPYAWRCPAAPHRLVLAALAELELAGEAQTHVGGTASRAV